ncbi:hypothetical protein M9H77_19122 [Catharanthus roseus]|uniref:Uncharacterized protein n=1 Tax=Catharanthus roseus TaxID=4058 RepID=A0ACC0B9E6_CATRO|nr:hypothetical protein M9H77_19122 [Catharanthus roseus]
MALRTQQGLQANGIYEFDLLEYLSWSEHIFLLATCPKFHSTTTKSRTAQSKIKTPKGKTFFSHFCCLLQSFNLSSRYGERNFTPQRDNEDHEIGNFLNLMSNCVDGPFKVVSKYFMIFCRRNFGYLDWSSMPLIKHRFLWEFDPALYPRINKSYMIRNDKLNETTNFVNMKLNVEEHEQIIGSTRHDQGAKRKSPFSIINYFKDLILIYKNSIHIFIFFNLLHTFFILLPPLLSDNHHRRCRQPPPIPDSHCRCLFLFLPPSSATEVKGNYVVLHHILKCSMSVIDEMNRKRRGFAIEKIDKIGTKGHIFTFLRVTSPEIHKRIRM